MKLSHLSARGVRGLPDLDVDLTASTGRPFDLVVITGPEASGKTRLCELILAGLERIGPYEGIVRASDWVRGPRESARLELGIWLDDGEREAFGDLGGRVVVSFGPEGVVCDASRELKRLVSRYDHDPSHGKREYFPEHRQRSWGGRLDGLGELEQSLWRASKDPQKYSAIPRFLDGLEDDPARRRVFEGALDRLAPGIRFSPGAQPDARTAMGRLANRTFFAAHGGALRLSDLSSSEADAVIIAATAAMIGLGHSVVLLDRPELHVDPKRLAPWVLGLSGLGAENQWIVATQRAALVSAVDPAQVVDLAQGAAR